MKNEDKFASIKAKHGMQDEHEFIDCKKPSSHELCKRTVNSKREIEWMRKFTGQWNNPIIGFSALNLGFTVEQMEAAGFPPDNPL